MDCMKTGKPWKDEDCGCCGFNGDCEAQPSAPSEFISLLETISQTGVAVLLAYCGYVLSTLGHGFDWLVLLCLATSVLIMAKFKISF